MMIDPPPKAEQKGDETNESDVEEDQSSKEADEEEPTVRKGNLPGYGVGVCKPDFVRQVAIGFKAVEICPGVRYLGPSNQS
jgi:hypothetical protein